MKESISITMIRTDSDEECELGLEFDYDDFLVIKLDGQKVCIGDWTANLRPALDRALALWPPEPGEGRP